MDADSVTLTWLGHSAVLLEHAGLRVAVDPFLTGNPKAALAASAVGPLDGIVLTHGHEDHVGDTVALAKRDGCAVVAVHELCGLLAQEGVARVEPGNTGGCIHLNVRGTPWSVTFVPAIHSSTYKGMPAGVACGVVIRLGTKVIYHAGDTAFFDEMRRIGEFHEPDVALWPVGDRFTMGPEEAAEAADLVGAPRNIPIHHGTWPLIAVDVHRFAPKQVKAVYLRSGESVRL